MPKIAKSDKTAKSKNNDQKIQKVQKRAKRAKKCKKNAKKGGFYFIGATIREIQRLPYAGFLPTQILIRAAKLTT